MAALPPNQSHARTGRRKPVVRLRPRVGSRGPIAGKTAPRVVPDRTSRAVNAARTGHRVMSPDGPAAPNTPSTVMRIAVTRPGPEATRGAMSQRCGE